MFLRSEIGSNFENPMSNAVQERQKKLIGSSTIGKMLAVQEKDRKYAEVSVKKRLACCFLL